MEDSRQVKWRQAAITLAVIGGVIGLVILGLYLSDPSRKIERVAREAESVKHYRTPGDGVDPSEIWITRSEAELTLLKKSNREFEHQIAELRRTVDELRERKPAMVPPRSGPLLPPPPPPRPAASPVKPLVAAATSKPVEGAPEEGAASQLVPLPPRPPVSRTGPRAGGPAGAARGILVVDLEVGAERAASAKGGAKPATLKRHVRHYLPAGAFARAVLLSGLDAPTGGVANTNPHPVLLKLADHGTLPNRFRSRVKECFVTAAGYGDISSERAYLRLERLSCVLEGGEVLEATVKGYVSGEDGKTGVRGRLVSKQGQIIAKSLLVGIAGGIGTGLAQTMTTTSTSALGAVQTVDPERLFQYGISQGASSALDKVAEWYLERANETYPIVEVDAGRTVDVIFTQGVDLGVDIGPATETGEAT